MPLDHALAGYHQDRGRTLQSLFGPVRYQRANYYCRRCGRGAHPFDDQAGVTSRGLTPAVEQLAALAGAVGDSFERGAELLQEMTGLRRSGPTVERTTEEAGQGIAEHLGAGTLFGEAVEWNWHADFRGRSVACVTIDATGTRQQGQGAGKADGRMAYVAGVYNAPPHKWLRPPGQAAPRLQARYASGLYSLHHMKHLLRRQAAQVGMQQAELWLVLTDGGSGLEEFVQVNFNRADLVVILDFYHAASYLEGLAWALHPGDEEKAAQQGRQWCRLLKEEGGATALAVLREWFWPARPSAALREQRARVEGYFANNLHRMDYPEYQAAAWPIGSGVVESACKTVVGQRLKGAGMRRGEAGALALCNVRALYRSEKGQWQAF